MTKEGRPEETLPPINKRQLRWFIRYITFYLRRNFHGLHLAFETPLPASVTDGPVLVCMNHPSWWDPLLALYLSQRLFPGRGNYGPIAGAGLSKYKFFERLGFFGVDNRSRSGAVRFLRLGTAALRGSSTSLWVTPQGHFADVRTRPVSIEPGVGHLAHRLNQLAMIPLAFEYTFWSERYPEAFACFGAPVFVDAGGDRSAREWNACFAQALERTQDHLSRLVQARNATAFEPLLQGSAGVGGMYDLWRAVKARLSGRKFQPEHGNI